MKPMITAGDDFDWAMKMATTLKPPEQRDRPIKGPALQKLLALELKKYIPYVLYEASSARYDMVAYLPDYIPMAKPKKEVEELACIHRIRRIYCDLKRHHFEIEARDAAWEMRRGRSIDRFNRGSGLSYSERRALERNWVNYIFNGKEYTTAKSLRWDEDFKARCKCDESEKCEYYSKQAVTWAEEHRQIRRLSPGLHLFEIKSDLDTHDRLTHQIPQMMEFADYVWLVLGDNQEIPEWLPPFIGVIRYAGGQWIIEQYGDHGLHSPGLYWQAFMGYGLGDKEAHRVANVLHAMRQMSRAWMINSIFHFDKYPSVGHGVLVDMTEYMEWTKDLRERARKVAATSPKDIETFKKRLVPKIESFFSELADQEETQ